MTCCRNRFKGDCEHLGGLWNAGHVSLITRPQNNPDQLMQQTQSECSRKQPSQAFLVAVVETRDTMAALFARPGKRLRMEVPYAFLCPCWASPPAALKQQLATKQQLRL